MKIADRYLEKLVIKPIEEMMNDTNDKALTTDEIKQCNGISVNRWCGISAAAKAIVLRSQKSPNPYFALVKSCGFGQVCSSNDFNERCILSTRETQMAGLDVGDGAWVDVCRYDSKQIVTDVFQASIFALWQAKPLILIYVVYRLAYKAILRRIKKFWRH